MQTAQPATLLSPPPAPSPLAEALQHARDLEWFLDYAHKHSCHEQDRRRWETAIEELRELRQLLAPLNPPVISPLSAVEGRGEPTRE